MKLLKSTEILKSPDELRETLGKFLTKQHLGSILHHLLKSLHKFRITLYN